MGDVKDGVVEGGVVGSEWLIQMVRRKRIQGL